MSRALLLMAYADALGRQPTDQERAGFLCALAKVAGGEYLYVPKLPQSEVDASVVQALRAEGMSIRKIARKLGVSKSTVGRAIRQPQLSQFSPYEVDSEAA
jgi:DNA invertase Pin-like site-specific DNA recombinase